MTGSPKDGAKQSLTPTAEHLVVAIDGPAGCGKSTVARRLADARSCTLLDTGAIYRTLSLLAAEQGIGLQDGPALADLAGQMPISFKRQGAANCVMVDRRDVTQAIRTPEVALAASKVSAVPEVRSALLSLQRRFAERGSVVAEGRDIGSVVFPNATLKVFLEASPEVRAQRRFEELRQAGHETTLDEVLAAQKQRDAADRNRDLAPLVAAPDAYVIDTSALNIDEVLEAILNRLRSATRRKKI